MKAMRLFAAITFFTLAMNLHSFGYSVLCQSLPKSQSVSDVFHPLFTCAIPANAVATGKSIRVTVYLHQVPLNNISLDSSLYLNGTAVGLGGATLDNEEQSLTYTITNTGGTGWSIGGVQMNGASSYAAVGTQNCATIPALPWSTGWTLGIWVAWSNSGTTTVLGDIFTVEILD